MRKSKKTTLYILFAIVSSLFNLLTQRIILSFSKTNLFFFFAIFFGTLFGLLIKFFLDKRYIFFDSKKGIIKVSRKFGLYTLMGTIPTLIFWGTESFFWIIWRQENMRELGAILGLTLGHSLKYRLDKRFVFKK